MSFNDRMLFGLLSAILLLPVELGGLHTSIEVDLEKLRTDTSIKVNTRRNAAETTITIGFKFSQPSDAYWHGYLTLIDENDKPLFNTVMRGEAIERALDELTLRNWDWMEFRPAEIFQFTVANKLMEKSKFAWELGPRNSHHGVNYGGGVTRWSYIEALAEMGDPSKVQQ